MSLASMFRWMGAFMPNYGNWGGLLRTDPDLNNPTLEPYDKLDTACMEHDLNRWALKFIDDEYEKELASKEADLLFHEELQKDLTPYLYPNKFIGRFYGPTWHKAAEVSFSGS